MDLVDLDLEEEVIASAPVTEEVDQYLQSFTDLLNSDVRNILSLFLQFHNLHLFLVVRI